MSTLTLLQLNIYLMPSGGPDATLPPPQNYQMPGSKNSSLSCQVVIFPATLLKSTLYSSILPAVSSIFNKIDLPLSSLVVRHEKNPSLKRSHYNSCRIQ